MIGFNVKCNTGLKWDKIRSPSKKKKKRNIAMLLENIVEGTKNF